MQDNHQAEISDLKLGFGLDFKKQDQQNQVQI